MIRPLRPDDRAAWLALWGDYCTFYGVNLAADVTETLWNRLHDDTFPIHGFAADVDGEIAGFALFVLHFHTWSNRPLCYLEDLYVRPDRRGKNLGHALIQYLVDLGHARGWGKVYWHTHHDNVTARRLYDRFGPADGYVRYNIRMTP
jgi:GNAT superfamily N-acetyltransferase